MPTMIKIRLVCMSLLLFATFVLRANCQYPDSSKTDANEAPIVQIYSNEDWYLSRPEPEEEWRGLFEKREVKAGPATRMALKYKLITKDQTISVYAANAESILEPFVGTQVLIRAKLVDLSSEGFGYELWISTIQRIVPKSD